MAGRRGQSAGHQRGGDAVLVAHHQRVHAVTDRLFVAVDDAGRPRDPLESGQRLGGGQTVPLGDPIEQRTRDQRAGQDRLRIAGVGASHVVTQQDAVLVAGQLPPTGLGGRVRHRQRAAVGVRVERDHQVGPDLAGQVDGQVDGTRLFRVREGDGREVRVGRALRLDQVQGLDAGLAQHPGRDLGADAVHRGQHDLQLFHLAGQVGERLEAGPQSVGGIAVGVLDLGAQHLDLADRLVGGRRRPGLRSRFGQRHRDASRRPDGLDRRLDALVGGLHELGATHPVGGDALAQVDLVAVVGRRVVGRGDHHARVSVQVPDREGQHRGRQRGGQQAGASPGRGHHPGDGARERIGAMPGVVADHHMELAAEVFGQHLAKPGRGGGHHGGVHPVAAGPDHPAQPRGAEGQRGTHRVVQLVDGLLFAGLGAVDQPLQGGLVSRIGIVGDPLACAADGVHHRCSPHCREDPLRLEASLTPPTPRRGPATQAFVASR